MTTEAQIPMNKMMTKVEQSTVMSSLHQITDIEESTAVLLMNQTLIFVENSTDSEHFIYENTTNGTLQSVQDAMMYFGLNGRLYWFIVLSIVVIGIIGNALVFIMMSDSKLTNLSYSVYLKFLAVSDSLVLCIKLAEESEKVFFLPSLININIVLCKILPWIKIVTGISSPWLVVGLSLDRCICICFPLKREIFCTRNKAFAVCSCTVVIFALINMVYMFSVDLVNGQCIPIRDINLFSMFFRLFSSLPPCLTILILNATIIVRIQKSNTFRKSFATTEIASSKTKQDSSTRPLVFICILAFVTLLPMSITQAIAFILIMIEKINVTIISVYRKMWPFVNIIFMLNFAQNLFILLKSSVNYRNILKRKFGCCKNRKGRDSNVTQPSTQSKNASSQTGTACDTLQSTSADITSSKLSFASANITDSAIQSISDGVINSALSKI